MSPHPDAAPRDHGGNLAEARARYGGAPSTWLDLSTGINPLPYPVGTVSPEAWTRLPEENGLSQLTHAARQAYEVAPEAEIVAAPGASALIRLMPRLATPARVAIPGPTYNEHAAAFAAEGWQVVDRPAPGVTAAVIVNPNNPDGRLWRCDELRVMAEVLDLLIVDESFIEPDPAEAMAPEAGLPGLVVLRSFGKFYGLAGVRLGFALAAPGLADRIADMLGPWAVSGPALEIGTKALLDAEWADATRARLIRDAARLCDLGARAGWTRVGGTALFQTFETGDAPAAQDRLARHGVWSRIFPYAPGWIRLGLPPSEAGWAQLEQALV